MFSPRGTQYGTRPLGRDRLARIAPPFLISASPQSEVVAQLHARELALERAAELRGTDPRVHAEREPRVLRQLGELGLAEIDQREPRELIRDERAEQHEDRPAIAELAHPHAVPPPDAEEQ